VFVYKPYALLRLSLIAKAKAERQKKNEEGRARNQVLADGRLDEDFLTGLAALEQSQAAAKEEEEGINLTSA
jgi:hypothetical protein